MSGLNVEYIEYGPASGYGRKGEVWQVFYKKKGIKNRNQLVQSAEWVQVDLRSGEKHDWILTQRTEPSISLKRGTWGSDIKLELDLKNRELKFQGQKHPKGWTIVKTLRHPKSEISAEAKLRQISQDLSKRYKSDFVSGRNVEYIEYGRGKKDVWSVFYKKQGVTQRNRVVKSAEWIEVDLKSGESRDWILTQRTDASVFLKRGTRRGDINLQFDLKARHMKYQGKIRKGLSILKTLRHPKSQK